MLCPASVTAVDWGLDGSDEDDAVSNADRFGWVDTEGMVTTAAATAATASRGPRGNRVRELSTMQPPATWN
jgi:hypothetical protein